MKHRISFQVSVFLLSLSSAVQATPQGTTQAITLFHTEDPNPGSSYERFALLQAGLDDINGDGICEVLIAIHDWNMSGFGTQEVQVLDGATGEMIVEHIEADFMYGTVLAGSTDHNGDGISDYFVGSPASFDNLLSGRVILYSGADHSIIHTFGSSSLLDEFGADVDVSADLNQDGINDILIGAPGLNLFGQSHPDGYVEVYDGQTYQLLLRISDTLNAPSLGISVAFLGDIDADGTVDVMASGSPYDNLETIIFSGATGATIHSFPSGGGYTYGDEVVSLGDINGDGYDDWASGNYLNNSRGEVLVYDGQSRTTLNVFTGQNNQRRYGQSLDIMNDLDGNGLPELVIGDPSETNDGFIDVRDPISGARHFKYFGAYNDVTPNLFFGEDLAVVDDLNGDGLQDIVTASRHLLHFVAISINGTAKVGLGCGQGGATPPSLDSSSIIQAGGPLVLEGTAQPFEQIRLLSSLQPKFFSTTGGGCIVYLSPIELLARPFSVSADAQGDFTFMGSIPLGGAGYSVVIQGFSSGGSLSNGLIVAIPE